MQRDHCDQGVNSILHDEAPAIRDVGYDIHAGREHTVKETNMMALYIIIVLQFSFMQVIIMQNPSCLDANDMVNTDNVYWKKI